MTAFPTGFLWGSATAGHQIEGNNTNSDWWARERGDGDQPAGDPADRGRDPSTDAHRASDQRAHGSTEQPEGEQR